jgi:hypothetical protein
VRSNSLLINSQYTLYIHTQALCDYGFQHRQTIWKDNIFHFAAQYVFTQNKLIKGSTIVQATSAQESQITLLQVGHTWKPLYVLYERADGP